MKFNYISSLIYELSNINPNDELSISKKAFYQNINIKNIFNKFDYNNKAKNKLFIFVNGIIRISNEVYEKRIQLLNETDIDDVIFMNLKKIKKENVEKFSNIFVNFINYKINYKDFKKLIKVVSSFNFSIYFSKYKMEEVEYLNEELGEEFYKYNLCYKIDCGLVKIMYKINDFGKNFLNNVYIDATPKEIKIYEKLIDYNYMEKSLSALEHKFYFDKTIKKMHLIDRCVQLGRLHKGKFKEFFEEYNSLIQFVILKYGIETKMRFCGFDTKEKIKCDGIVFHENREDKIEITCNFFDKEEVIRMNDLNQFGHTSVETYDFDKIESIVVNHVVKAIDNKNHKTSYDSTVTLVVILNNFYGMPSEKIRNDEYLNKLFAFLRKKNYVFGRVYILVDEYNDIPARLIKIK